MSAPPDYVFFTDRDLGKQFPEILRKAGINVKSHGDHFADDAKDEDWLKIVGERGWYVLTHDRRMRYRSNEIDAISRFNIGMFVIVGKSPLAELAHNFVHTLHQIIRFISKNPRPFIAKIYRPDSKNIKTKSDASGYVKMWVSF